MVGGLADKQEGIMEQFDSRMQDLSLLIGHPKTTDLFYQDYQRNLDDLAAEIKAGELDKVTALQRGMRLKALLIGQMIWMRMQMDAAQEEGIPPIAKRRNCRFVLCRNSGRPPLCGHCFRVHLQSNCPRPYNVFLRPMTGQSRHIRTAAI